MTFKTQIATDQTVFFNSDEFGEEIEYTASGAEAKTFTALLKFQNEDAFDVSGSNPEKFRQKGQVQIPKTEIASPGYKDFFTFGGKTYYVTHTEREDTISSLCGFETRPRPTFRM